MQAAACFLAVLLFGCSSVHGPKGPSIADNERVCLVTINTTTQTALYEPAVVLAHHPNGTDVWLYLPERSQDEFVGIDGKIRGLNFPEERVLRTHEVRIIHGVKCVCPE